MIKNDIDLKINNGKDATSRLESRIRSQVVELDKLREKVENLEAADNLALARNRFG